MSHQKHTLGSLFDGSGGFPLGGLLHGIEPVWASEVEPYPIAVTKHHFPNMKHLGDVSKIHGGEIDPVDVVTFGSPCFPAGTMIDTDKGRVPIEKVTVGMRVLTHMGRYRPVLAVGSKISDTIILLDELGETLECTRNHPIYSAKKIMYNGVNVIGDIGMWTQAKDMLGLLWSRPVVPKDLFYNPYLFVNAWQKVVSISVGRENIQVYNMTVKEDNSYLADGIIVHNCQDMSVAGKRAGLLHTGKGDDTTTRSGLFYEAIRIIKEMRESTHGKYPSFAVWENVPGAFTSAKGEDFRCVLEELMQIAEGGLSIPRPANGKWLHAGEIMADHCSIAWRILDAQYWGVPQRRKRIYLVADFGGQRAGEILFERESMRGYFAQGGEARQGVASDSQASSAPDDRTGEAGRGLDDIGLDLYNHAMTVDKAATLTSTMHKGGTNSGPTVCYQTPYMLKVHTGVAIDSAGKAAGKVALVQEDKAMTLATTQDQYLFQPVPDVMLDDQGGQQIGVRTDGKSPTLRAEMHGNIPCVVEAGGFCPEQSAKTRGLGREEEMSPTLRAGVTPEVVAGLEPTVCDAQQAIAEYKQSEVASNQTARQYKSETDLVCCVDCRNLTETQELYQTLQAKSNGGHSLNYSGAVRIEYIVRRLTPLECNRLQGFPDGWGDIPHKDDMSDEEYAFWANVRNTHIAITGKSPKSFTKKSIIDWYNKLHTDSAEYKMWGNGVAEPCVTFVMSGIAEALAGKFDK